MKPTPTNFLGIRFRSRSEAMFALSLVKSFEAAERHQRELSQENRIVRVGGGGFQYEPRTWIEDWRPDFLAWNIVPPSLRIVDHDQEDLIPMPALNIEFIEYKPSRPSESYVDRFVVNVERWFWSRHNEHNQHDHHPFQFHIFYGSPYLEDRESTCGQIIVVPCVNCGGKAFIYDCKRDWTSPELLDYRFDLADGGAPCSR